MMPDTGDAETYLAGAVAIIAEYPRHVGEAFADPRSGTRYLRDYPTLSALRRACDDVYEPMKRDDERASIHYFPRELPRPPRTPEEQARVDASITDWKRRSAGMGHE
jgi:hypothetical protein